MSYLHFTLLMIGIILFGVFVGIVSYIISSIRNKNTPDDFCGTNYVYPKFDDHEIFIDEVCKNFKILDM